MISTNSQNAHAVSSTFFHLPRRGKQSTKNAITMKTKKKNCSRSNSAAAKKITTLNSVFHFIWRPIFFRSFLKRKKRNRTHEHKLWGIKNMRVCNDDDEIGFLTEILMSVSNTDGEKKKQDFNKIHVPRQRF